MKVPKYSLLTLKCLQETLEHISFNTNPIGDEGICKVAETLMGNNTLTDVDLGNTDLVHIFSSSHVLCIFCFLVFFMLIFFWCAGIIILCNTLHYQSVLAVIRISCMLTANTTVTNLNLDNPLLHGVMVRTTD